MIFFSLDSSGTAKRRSEIFADKAFWEVNGPIIIFSIVLLAVLLTILTVYLVRRYINAQEKTCVNGRTVFSKRVIQVTLLGSGVSDLVKGDYFEAPLIRRDGYDFCGWFRDSACSVPFINSRIYHNLTLYPKWVKSN